MKIKPAFVASAAAAAAAVGVAAAPFASAEDVEVQSLGQPGELVNGDVVQHWTIVGLKPSTDVIPYQPAGTLWEATATDEAIAGSALPIVSNLNARAENGETYRVLFGIATPQGINPSTLAQGEKATGKVYFDVTGQSPDSVVYNGGGEDLLVWVEPPPAPAPASGSGSPAPARTYTAPAETPDTTGDSPETTETSAPTPDAEAAPEASAPEGSSGTPLPEGSSGTPLPEGSSGTPLPEGSAPTTTAVVPAPPA